MNEVVEGPKPSRRVRVERGIYRQANGKYVVCFMLDGKPRFRTMVADVAELLDRLRERGCAEKTVAGALGTLNNVMRFAVRNSWIAESPVEKLERHERPQPERHPQRASGVRRSRGCSPTAYPSIETW